MSKSKKKTKNVTDEITIKLNADEIAKTIADPYSSFKEKNEALKNAGEATGQKPLKIKDEVDFKDPITIDPPEKSESSLRLKLRRDLFTEEELNAELTDTEWHEFKDMLDTKLRVLSALVNTFEHNPDSESRLLVNRLDLLLDPSHNEDTCKKYTFKDVKILIDEIDNKLDVYENDLDRLKLTRSDVLDLVLRHNYVSPTQGNIHDMLKNPKILNLKTEMGRVDELIKNFGTDHKSTELKYDKKAMLNTLGIPENKSNKKSKEESKDTYDNVYIDLATGKLHVSFYTKFLFSSYKDNGVKYENLKKYGHSFEVVGLDTFEKNVLNLIPVAYFKYISKTLVDTKYSRFIDKMKEIYCRIFNINELTLYEKKHGCKVEKIQDILLFNFKNPNKTLMFKFVPSKNPRILVFLMSDELDNNKISFEANFLLSAIKLVKQLVMKYAEQPAGDHLQTEAIKELRKETEKIIKNVDMTIEHLKNIVNSQVSDEK